MLERPFLAFALALTVAAHCPAQQPGVGTDAPPIQAAAWLNWQHRCAGVPGATRPGE